MSARRDFLAGVRAVAPILVGILPFALVAGAAGVSAGLTAVQTVAMSVLVFAGASQLAAIDLFGRDAPVAVVVATALVVNLRHVMYSASIAPYFRRFSAPAKWLGAYVLTDQAYALSLAEYRETTPETRSRWWFYLGTAATLWTVWQAGTAAGALLGAGVPDGLSLEFAVPLTFTALLFGAVDDRTTGVAAVCGGGIGAVAAPLPFNLGLVVGALAGVVAGVLVESRAGRFPSGVDAADAADSDGGEERGAEGGESA